MRAQPAIARRIGIGLVAVCVALVTSSCAAGQKAETARATPVVDGTNGQVGSMQLHAVAIKAPSGASYAQGTDALMTLIIVNNGRDKDTLTTVSSPRFRTVGFYSSADDADAHAKADATASSSASDTGSASSSASGPSGTGSASSSASGTPSGSPTSSASGSPSGTGSASGATLPAATGSLDVKAGWSLPIGLTGTGTDTSGQPALLLQGLQKGDLHPGESIPVTFTFAHAGSITLTVPVQLSVAPNNSYLPSGTQTG